DGLVDAADPDLGAAPNICSNVGACATGTTISCDGAQGWTCHYNGPDVSKDMVTGQIIPETKCDGIDNDCNGILDDHQPNKGQACNDGNLGECQNAGFYGCNAVDLNGPAVCDNSVHTGVAAKPESCDGKDNDCDGVIDNPGMPGVPAAPGTYFGDPP